MPLCRQRINLRALHQIDLPCVRSRHDMEALTEDGAFSVDILIRRDGIAVEVCTTRDPVMTRVIRLNCKPASCVSAKPRSYDKYGRHTASRHGTSTACLHTG